jgi:hypothetical protein
VTTNPFSVHDRRRAVLLCLGDGHIESN